MNHITASALEIQVAKLKIVTASFEDHGQCSNGLMHAVLLPEAMHQEFHLPGPLQRHRFNRLLQTVCKQSPIAMLFCIIALEQYILSRQLTCSITVPCTYIS